MQVAVLVPVRSGGSGGFVKHLCEVIPRWKQTGCFKKISIIAPEGMFNLFKNLGVDIQEVGRNDYRRGFRQMKEIVENGQYDVVFNTTARPVKINGIPIVTKVQNIEPIQKRTYNASFLWKMRLWAMRREHSIACRTSTRVLAVSNYVKEEVWRRFGVSRDKIDVVCHGFDAAEGNNARMPDLNIQPGEFLFSAGSIVPYRGYEDIIRALGKLQKDGVKPPCVVLAGSTSSSARRYERFLKQLALSYKVQDSIIWAGQLPREEISWCFQNAKMFIQASRAEACPNVVLEAMGHGCPAISCDFPPMPEFFQNTACYYSVGDSSGLAAKILDLIEMDEIEINKIQMKQRQRAKLFSWDETAKLTLESLNRAID